MNTQSHENRRLGTWHTLVAEEGQMKEVSHVVSDLGLYFMGH